MKAADKKKIQKQCIEFIQGIGGIKDSSRTLTDSFILNTKIGKVRVSIDANCKSKVMSVFVNFFEDPKQAKQVFNHWKVNLHIGDTPNFLLYVEEHINGIIRSIDLFTKKSIQ